ncbi:MAG: hypothetical protein ACLQU1_41400 [Bryobacteraceae bacterium]
MREYIVPALILLFAPLVPAQVAPAGWLIIKDSKSACQMAVPPDWAQYGENHGVAVFHDVSTAIAVVTSQPEQAFKPLPEAVQRVMNIPKEKMFENTAKRVFYQDKISQNREDPSAYSIAVPGKAGTCSGHLTFLPSIPVEVARKIALSLGPVPEPPPSS